MPATNRRVKNQIHVDKILTQAADKATGMFFYIEIMPWHVAPTDNKTRNHGEEGVR